MNLKVLIFLSKFSVFPFPSVVCASRRKSKKGIGCRRKEPIIIHRTFRRRRSLDGRAPLIGAQIGPFLPPLPTVTPPFLRPPSNLIFRKKCEKLGFPKIGMSSLIIGNYSKICHRKRNGCPWGSSMCLSKVGGRAVGKRFALSLRFRLIPLSGGGAMNNVRAQKKVKKRKEDGWMDDLVKG